MSTNVGLGFRKKEYNSSTDNTSGVVTFDTTSKKIYLAGDSYGGDSLYVEKTYSQLAAMVTGGTLVKGQKYRITDYVTTTATTNTTSANHAFDLVVTATDINKLDSMAQALPHSGDTYFSTAGADLTKWQVWYDINNDTTKYAWAEATNGKGVIYRLIDEWGNDCPYDFKNILFTVTGKTANAYTFNVYSNSTCSDHSLNGRYCYGNVIKPYYVSGIQNLNFNVFYNTSSTASCYSNTFGNNCSSNTFGNNCYSNTFGDACQYNILGNYCFSNTFGDGCQNNRFGNSCYFNTFGNNCYNNTFGNYCQTNTFGDNCYINTFRNYCRDNTLGNECNSIVFGNSSNLGGTYCRFNIIENGNKYIRLYQTSGTASDNNYLQNVYIAQGVNNTNTWYDISTIARNLSYRTTVAMNKAGTDRVIYCEDDITDMLPSMTNNAGKVLSVNSGATGVEWTTPDTGDDLYVEKTYAQLTAMVSGGTLVKGQKYRITDYVTTTTTENTSSAGHAFDLVVTAIDTNKLDCMAQALPHSGDTYFSTAGADLTKWQVWYDINNDTTKYAWASSDDAINSSDIEYIKPPYDDLPSSFKQFLEHESIDYSDDDVGFWYNETTINTRYYLFSTDGGESLTQDYQVRLMDDEDYTSNRYATFYEYGTELDELHVGLINGNTIIIGKGVIYRLIDEWGNDCPYDFKNILFTVSGKTASAYTFNVYSNSTCSDHSLNGRYCYGNVMKPYHNSGIQTLNFNVFYNTSVTNNCYSNTFGNNCYSNTFGNYCHTNTFGNNCNSNTFGDDCVSNTFGNNCYSNTFGNECVSNTFLDNCYFNTFGDDCVSNTFGNSCNSNTFGDDCGSNIFGDSCESNTFGDGCEYNTFGDSCVSNRFGYNCDSNTFGNGCDSNTFGDSCEYNTFGNGCNYIVFGNSSTPSVGGTYCRYNIIENGNQYIRLYQTTDEGSSNYLQNIYIAQGVNNNVNNTTTYVEISTIARSLSYRTTVGKLSNGNIRIYNEDESTTIDVTPITEIEYDYIFGNAGDMFLTVLYIDDFPPEKIPDLEDEYHRTFSEHIQTICNNVEYAMNCGTNFFTPTTETMTYEGNTYRIWMCLTSTNGDGLTFGGVYGLMSDSITYAQLQSMSMESDINNRQSPFVAVFTDFDFVTTEPYTEDMGDSYTLIHVGGVYKETKPASSSHPSTFSKIYLEYYGTDGECGFYENLYDSNAVTMSLFVDYVVNTENPDQTFEYYDDLVYEGQTYQIWADEATDCFGGLISPNTTYQDIYPHTLEADTDNFYTPYCPFEYSWRNNDGEVIGGYDPVTDKWTTTIAIR